MHQTCSRSILLSRDWFTLLKRNYIYVAVKQGEYHEGLNENGKVYEAEEEGKMFHTTILEIFIHISLNFII